MLERPLWTGVVVKLGKASILSYFEFKRGQDCTFLLLEVLHCILCSLEPLKVTEIAHNIGYL